MVTFTVLVDIDPAAVAEDITHEVGAWGVSQLGEQGVRAAIHDHCRESHGLLPWQQEQLFKLVHDELYG